jgi:hypothetical protein
MQIQDNQSLWKYRRRIALRSSILMFIIVILHVIISWLICYNIPTERLIALEYVFIGIYISLAVFFCVLGLIILSYYHYTTQHDKAFLPSIIEAFRK